MPVGFQIIGIISMPFSLQVQYICTDRQCKGMTHVCPRLLRVTHSCYTDISQLSSLLSPREAQMRELRMKLHQFMRPWDSSRQCPLWRKIKCFENKEKSHMERNCQNDTSICEILFQPNHLYNLKVTVSLLRQTWLWRHKNNSFDNYSSNTHINSITIESCSENPSVYWQKMDLWQQRLERGGKTAKEDEKLRKNPHSSS